MVINLGVIYSWKLRHMRLLRRYDNFNLYQQTLETVAALYISQLTQEIKANHSQLYLQLLCDNHLCLLSCWQGYI